MCVPAPAALLNDGRRRHRTALLTDALLPAGARGAAQPPQDLEGLSVHGVDPVGVDLDARVQRDRSALEVGVLPRHVLLDEVVQVLDQGQSPGVLAGDLVLGRHLQALPQHHLQLARAQRPAGAAIGRDILLLGRRHGGHGASLFAR
jgi:hypothetical protein